MSSKPAKKNTPKKAAPKAAKPKPKQAPKKKSNSSGGMNTAKSSSKKAGKMGGVSHHITGNTLIYTLNTGSTVPADAQVLYKVYVNPKTLAGPRTRLSKLAGLFEKFTCDKLVLRYENVAAQTFSGSSLAWYEANPLKNFPQFSDELRQTVSEQDHWRQVPLCKTGTLVIPKSSMINAIGGRYFCDPTNADDPTTTYAGRVWIGCNGPLLANTQYGTWYVDWAFTFYEDTCDNEDDDEAVRFTTPPGQSATTSPLGTSIGLIQLGSSSFISLTGSGTASVLTFLAGIGTYCGSVLTTGSGGAALTSTSTVVAVGCTQVNIIYSAVTGTQKVWDFIVTTTAPNATLSVSDAGGQTHPNGAVIHQWAYEPTSTSLTKSELNALATKAIAADWEKRFNDLVALTNRASLALPGTATTSYNLDVSGPSTPPVHISGSTTSDIGVLEVVAAPATTARRKEKKEKRRAASSSDSE